jgi:hypothetical protein
MDNCLGDSVDMAYFFSWGNADTPRALVRIA